MGCLLQRLGYFRTVNAERVTVCDNVHEFYDCAGHMLHRLSTWKTWYVLYSGYLSQQIAVVLRCISSVVSTMISHGLPSWASCLIVGPKSFNKPPLFFGGRCTAAVYCDSQNDGTNHGEIPLEQCVALCRSTFNCNYIQYDCNEAQTR